MTGPNFLRDLIFAQESSCYFDTERQKSKFKRIFLLLEIIADKIKLWMTDLKKFQGTGEPSEPSGVTAGPAVSRHG